MKTDFNYFILNVCVLSAELANRTPELIKWLCLIKHDESQKFLKHNANTNGIHYGNKVYNLRERERGRLRSEIPT